MNDDDPEFGTEGFEPEPLPAEGADALRGRGLAAVLGGMLLGRARRSARRARPRPRLMRRFAFGLVIVVLSVTTCSWGVEPSALTAEWGPPVAASRDDAARVLTRGAEALRSLPETGAVRISVTESEATAALSVGLMMSDLMMVMGRMSPDELEQAADLDELRQRVWAEADAQRRELAEQSGFLARMLLMVDPNFKTGDVQVRFEPTGQVVVGGYVQAWRFRLPGVFVVAPSARDGSLEFDFVSGQLGRLPLPEFAFDFLGGLVARTILLGQGVAEITELSVGDGTLSFAGRRTGTP